MRTIPFGRPAAWVTIGEALGLAWRYWTATWDRWVLAVVAVALADGLATALLGETIVDQQVMRDMLAGGTVDPSIVPRLMAGPLALAVVSIVADWFLYANAVAGLRGREVTLGWVLRSGLRVLVALLLVSLIVTLLASALVLLGAVGLLVLLLLVVPAAYVAIRCQFWVAGIFDGHTISGALFQSWDLTRGAVLRVLGWGAAMFGLSMIVGIAVGIVTGVLAVMPGPMAGIAAAIGSLVQTAFQAFAVIMIAILYESQRQRRSAQPVIPTPQASYDPNGPEPPPPPSFP